MVIFNGVIFIDFRGKERIDCNGVLMFICLVFLIILLRLIWLLINIVGILVELVIVWWMDIELEKLLL